MSHRISKAAQVFVAVILATIASVQSYASDLVDIKFTALPGDVTQMELIFDGEPPVAGGYTIEKPARISLDLPGVNSKLKSKYHKIGFGNARTATVVNAKGKARVIVSLSQLVPYAVESSGNRLLVSMGKAIDVSQQPQANITAANSGATEISTIMNVDFRRGDQDDGQVARINCYIRMLQAVENNADASTIKIVIRYVDDDPVKLDTLSRFIAKVR